MIIPALRTAIQTKSATLMKRAGEVVQGRSLRRQHQVAGRVREQGADALCGQFSEKDKCNGSNLCGWKTEKGKGVCKVRVKPVVDKTEVLKRIVKTLRENDKQRALVLDERMSPFFSTILYLELPHELITTTI
jgi:hypothetical protein